MEQPRVLILGHSFIRRLRDFIIKNSPTYNLNLNINASVTIHWHGVGVAQSTRLGGSTKPK